MEGVGTLLYKDYLSALIERLKERVGEDGIRIYTKGYKPSNAEEKQYVKETNRLYFGSNTGVLLLGDTIVMTMPNKSGSLQKNMRVMPSLNYKAGKTVDEVIEKIDNDMNAFSDSSEYMDRIELRGTDNYELIKDQIILRPLNFYRHANELQEAVYEREGDIAIVLYQLLSDGDENLLTSKIQRTEVENWGKLDDLEAVFHDAMNNTMRLFPAVALDQKTQKEVDFLKTDIASADDIATPTGSILLSTTRTTNGALAIFYPGVREKLHQLLGPAFYAVFMNINDVMAVPKSNSSKARAFLASARHGGEMGEMLSETMFLSDKRGFNPTK